MRVGPNVYLRADGRWEARYQKALDEKGRIVYGYVYGHTQDEAIQKRSERLKELQMGEESDSILGSQNPDIKAMPQCIDSTKRVKGKREKFKPPFDTETARLIQLQLLKSNQLESTALLISLLVGLSVGEIVALRYGDLSFSSYEIHVTHAAVVDKRRLTLEETAHRTIPMTDYVLKLLVDRGCLQKNHEDFILTDSPHMEESTRRIETTFRKILQECLDAQSLSAESLRSTFIRRCLESNMNIETVSVLSGADCATLYRYFGMYIHADPMEIKRGDRYAQMIHTNESRHMNLLILGAGSHGQEAKEIARKSGMFEKIKFLDDQSQNPDVIGNCADYMLFQRDFPIAIPAFNENHLRQVWLQRLQYSGYLLPKLIHHTANVSDNVEIGEGTIIMAQATVNSGSKIGKGCIIAPNAMAGFCSEIGSYANLDSGAIVSSHAHVPEAWSVESGEIFRTDFHPI